jgi:hypothetical protein
VVSGSGDGVGFSKLVREMFLLVSRKTADAIDILYTIPFQYIILSQTTDVKQLDPSLPTRVGIGKDRRALDSSSLSHLEGLNRRPFNLSASASSVKVFTRSCCV